MINFEIDEQKIQVELGSMIIQAADKVGIYIPRFCYHKKLSIAANCRMCLVQIGENKKPVPACATPVIEGMKVWTKSKVALDAQKAVMEFLLINHPLDCPICDQGGECELQDLSMGYGDDNSRYIEKKRVIKDKNIGPLIQTDMTRCIQCTRCVRFGKEIADFQEFGVLNRGEKEEIGTYIAGAMESELSGNVIDVCPVGALTAKPSRYVARAWELQQRDTVSPHDGVGSNLHAHILKNKVLRMVPRENEAVNEIWISDRDRFAYQGLNSPERVTQAMIKRDGQWETVDWFVALEFVMEKLQAVITKFSAEKIAGFISPNVTLEEHYLFQKFLRGIGTQHIDHRLQQIDFRDEASWPLTPSLGVKLSEIENLSSILLIGTNIQSDQPVLGIRLHKAAKKGASLMAVHHYAWQKNLYFIQEALTSDISRSLAGILKVAGCTYKLVQDVEATQTERAIAEKLLETPTTIFLGTEAFHDPEASTIHFLARLLAKQTGSTLGYLPMGGNVVGAWLAGSVPHRHVGGSSVQAGTNWQTALEKKLKAYFLLDVEPEFDFAQPALALSAFKQAEFVVAMTSFKTEAMLEYADVILPIAPFTENSGTFVNLQGDWQIFKAVVPPLEETRPAWKVLRVLGNFFKLKNFEYVSVDEVTAEVKEVIESANVTEKIWQPTTLPIAKKISCVTPVASYRSDTIVRRAIALQMTPRNQAKVVMNKYTANKLRVASSSIVLMMQGENKIKLPLELSEKVADAVIVIPRGFVETQAFNLQAEFEVKAC